MKIRKYAALAATALAASLALTACGGNGATTDVGTGDAGAVVADGDCGAAPSTLTISFWSPIEPSIIQSFTDEYGINVQINNSPEAAVAYEAIRNGLATGGAGLSDLHYMEADSIPELMAVPGDWATLPTVAGRWLDWKDAQATIDGNLKGYGTDIGPLAIAFDSEALAEAGLPSDPAAFAEFLGGDNATWQSYFDAGRQYRAATGRAWLNNVGDALNAAVQQLPDPYENPATGMPYDLSCNEPIHAIFTQFGQAIEDGLSAGISTWGPDAAPGFQQSSFATVIAPAWMTGHISNSVGDRTGWRIAEVFPEGGGNWGGSFIAMPATGDNVCWATVLANWLTSPENAVTQFLYQGHFPSQIAALENPEVTDTENPFFGNQQVGGIYAAMAAKTPVAATTGFRGERFPGIMALVGEGLGRVQDGIETTAQAWDSTVAEFEALGLPVEGCN